jgi:hypothetical protein
VDPDPNLDTPDPCPWLMDPDADPDPAIFVLDLQDANKKLILKQVFLLITFDGTCTIVHHFSKIKSQKRSRNQGFSYYFCLVIEGSGSIALTTGSRFGSGSATLVLTYVVLTIVRVAF